MIDYFCGYEYETYQVPANHQTMKQFFKMLLASTVGAAIAIGLMTIFIFSLFGSLAAIGSKQAVTVPTSAILTIDLSDGIAEQSSDEPFNFQSMMNGGEMSTSNIGILDAVRAIDNAAQDPAIKFIYIKECDFSAEISHLEEIRAALMRFRNSGKPIIAFGTNLSLGGWYIASTADKIYLTELASNQVFGISSRIFYLKDILERLGVNVQLIRHGKYKSAGEMFIANDISEANREQNQSMISSMWKSLTDPIAESRNLTREAIDDITNGLKASTSAEMLELGMIDGIKTKSEMASELCSLFGVEMEKELKYIGLADYGSASIKDDLKIKEKIAVIYADGEINSGNEEDQISDGHFCKIIAKVRADSTVKAVVFRVNSPGGDAQAAELIRNEMTLLSKDKPVIASYGSYAASGGYWISAGADKIFTDATTLTGSIGVFSIIPDFSRIIKEKIHVNPVSIKSNTHADMLSMMKAFDETELAYMQSTVEQVYDKFLGIVADGRDMSTDAVNELAQGRVWTGVQAVENGLADECGTLIDAINYAASAASLENYRLISYPTVKTQIEKILSNMSDTEESARAFMNITDPEQFISTLTEQARRHTACKAMMPYYYQFNF